MTVEITVMKMDVDQVCDVWYIKVNIIMMLSHLHDKAVAKHDK